MTAVLPDEVHRKPRHPLTNPAFLALWVVQAVTQTAHNVINFCLLVLTQTLTGSSTQVALIILSFSLPAVLFSSLAGVLVDRWEKRTVMVWSNAIRGVTVLAYVFVNDPDEMIWVYLATFLFSTSAQFFAPAEGAVIPRLVGRNQLIAANSVYNMTFMASQFLGFTAVGWALVRSMGLRNVFILIVVLYLVASVVLRLIPIPSMRTASREGQTVERIWRELLEGLDYIRARQHMVMAIVHLSIATMVFLMIGTIGPAFVSRVLRTSAADLGILLAPAGLCVLVGAVAVQRLARPDNRHAMIHAGMLGIGASLIALAAVDPLFRLVSAVSGGPLGQTGITVLTVVLCMAFGFSAAFVMIPAQTVLQESATDENRARVLSAFYTVSNAAAFFPILLAGSVADVLGILQTLALVGVLVLAVAIVSKRRDTASLDARYRAPAE
jgi:MFS family permease